MTIRYRNLTFIFLFYSFLTQANWILAKTKKSVPVIELNDKGRTLETKFQQRLNQLEADLKKQIFTDESGYKSLIQNALENLNQARNSFQRVEQAIEGPRKAEKLVAQVKNKWIKEAKNGIEKAQQTLQKAQNNKDKKRAQKELVKFQKKLEEGEKALTLRLENLKLAKAAEKNGPAMMREAQQKLTQARLSLKVAIIEAKLENVIYRGALDAQLAQFVILREASPKGLAEFSQKSLANETAVENLFSNPELMKQMLVADGAKAQRYGKVSGPAQFGMAAAIYQQILASNEKAKSGLFRRLALAIALEHSVPIEQRNPSAETDAPNTVNPYERYRHYEKAYLAGELDPEFKNLNTWDLRMVVDGNEPNKILTWGRKMLRNYQPAHINTSNFGWRYVRIVASDVKYGSGDVKLDRPELQFFQNILMNGGICGRRAFFGRFILRAFGIPTIARPSKGHAALAHWTPSGWVINLGPGWGNGWVKTAYDKDTNFLATSQARNHPSAFLAVKRTQWIGDLAAEKRVYGEQNQGEPDFWNSLALALQYEIIQKSKARTLAALGTNIGESNATPEGPDTVKSTSKKEFVSLGKSGVITIPVSAFNPDTSKHRQAKLIESFVQGSQLIMPRFFQEGKTILRGGTWKSSAELTSSGTRLLSDGYGRYNNWGFRAALSPSEKSKNRPKEITVKISEKISMEFVYIKPGSFVMGGENKKDAKFSCIEVPKHPVTISKGFYLGKYEVTQEQYQAVMGSNPSKSSKGADFPVDNVSEDDALSFCKILSQNSKQNIRLPYEAEWEYAARAGTQSTWFMGTTASKLDEYAWFESNSGGASHPVGKKKPNPWGLYDIYGNVCERIADRYEKNYYKNSPKIDPTGPGLNKKSEMHYTVNTPKAGTYMMRALVVTNNYNQHLMVSMNDAQAMVLNLPFTCGDWVNTEPIKVELKQGKNDIEIHRITPPQAGIAIKSFTLTPAQ